MCSGIERISSGGMLQCVVGLWGFCLVVYYSVQWYWADFIWWYVTTCSTTANTGVWWYITVCSGIERILSGGMLHCAVGLWTLWSGGMLHHVVWQWWLSSGLVFQHIRWLSGLWSGGMLHCTVGQWGLWSSHTLKCPCQVPIWKKNSASPNKILIWISAD
jgi:hypothetical protein